MLEKIPVLVLFGPTGSGKTEILERLFGQNGRAEVVSADSMQVYRSMNIGTAKPSLELRKMLTHHLIDIRNPNEQFNVGEFVQLADKHCSEIAEKGLLPVVSGGTGFYLKNFVEGLPPAPPSNPEIREGLKEELRLNGKERLLAELADCDPESAKRIHANDEYRLLRALEVFRLTQSPLSSFPISSNRTREQYSFLIIGLMRNREDLYKRINERCACMFRSGLVDEVEELFSRGYTPYDPALKAIGYREFFEQNTDGSYFLSKDFEEIEYLVSRNSRRYAKRQITYFASIPEVVWVSAEDDPVDTIVKLLYDKFVFAV